MERIDSHQHFWHYNRKDYGWMDDQMATIRRDFLPPDLEKELKNQGFDGCIAVQARQSVEETEWLLGLAGQYSFVRGVVGWVDLRSANLEQQLDQYSQHPKFVGVRHVLHDEPDIGFMLKDDFLKGIATLQKYGLTYDLLIFPRHLPNALTLVKMFPEQRFILDHIAKPLIRDQVISPWKEDLESLAAQPNVYCKVSGMVTEADWHRWNPADFTPFLDVVFRAFGTDRIMFGSDWPVCTVVASYSQVVGIVKNYLAAWPQSEYRKIMGENAIKAYGLNNHRGE